VAPPPGGWSLEEAYRWCGNLARRHYENFPVASLLLPRDLRKELAAVYAFARGADDFADEGQWDQSSRLALLDAWQEELERCRDSSSSHPVFLALGDLLRRRNLGLEPFVHLLDAFRQDCTKKRYRDWEDLFAYCRLSANPVGRILLALAGYPGEHHARLSDAICTALQLTNFWQDVRSDFQRGRIYIPEAELERFGVSPGELSSSAASPRLKECLRVCVARTDELFLAGEPLLGMVKASLAFHLRLVVLGGRRILEKIARQDYDTLSRRPALGRGDWALLLVRAAWAAQGG
jgi:phytoene synthase